MRIVLATVGSRGDVQPSALLARALKLRGHDVLLAAPPGFRPWADDFDLEFAPLGSDIHALVVDNPDISSKNPFAALPKQMQLMRREVAGQFRDLGAAAEGADFVVGGGVLAAGSSVAERLGVPFAYLAMQNQIVPSRHHPPAMVPWYGLPRILNVLAWKSFGLLTRYVFLPPINNERERLGLGKLREVMDLVLGGRVFVATDNVVFPLPPDAKSSGALQVGAITADELEAIEHSHARRMVRGYDARHGEGYVEGFRDTLPADVEAFLAAGDKPIFVGFGSMPDPNPAQTTELLFEALRIAGVRAFMARGWAGYGEAAVPDYVKLIGNVPHNLLFPRTALLVHHGGAGTFATACRAGVPQVVVPQLLDQFFHAHVAVRSGLGPRGPVRTRLTARRLADAIRRALDEPSYRVRAMQLADALRAHGGIARTITEIERIGGV